MKIGVITDSFKASTSEGIKKAAELGLDGVQIYAVSGDFCYDALTPEKIGEYKKLIKETGLTVIALCGDFGGHGFRRSEDNPEKIRKTKEVVDLASEFGAKVVTTHVGVIPEDSESELYREMLKTARACGDYARSKGVTLAIETGPETAPILNKFVNAAGDGVGVNLDPANFVMVTGQDPAEAVRLLGKKIVHTHLKDGIMLKKCDPEIIYYSFAVGGIEGLSAQDFFKETPVGEGNVNWDEYISALREIGYDGFLTIEREVGDNPSADIKTAADFVRARGYLD